MSRGREKLVTEQPSAPRWRWTALPAATRQRRLPFLPRRPLRKRAIAASGNLEPPADVLADSRDALAGRIVQSDLRRNSLRHREAQREARRRRAWLLSGALRFPSGQPKHGEPMVNTASFPSGGALDVRGARGRGLRGEARAKNTNRMGYSHTDAFFLSERPNPQ